MDASTQTVGTTQLSKTLRLPKARTSQIINNPQAQGYLTREMQSSDPRRFRLKLTKQGAKKATDAMRVYDDLDHHIEALLKKTDSKALCKTLGTLTSQLG